MGLIVIALAGLLLGRTSVAISVTAVIMWGLALGAFPVLSQVLAIRASHEVPAAAAPMINTTFKTSASPPARLPRTHPRHQQLNGAHPRQHHHRSSRHRHQLLHRWLPAD